ncbi:anhydro-N-acetylmuramic acid kinase [Curvibacter sp. APW13]|uniref:anhydro-N-acetylmuramic acid kinase n=1 Tax=Curvibacter sp. APW13 TaxID=3077236 RepID=UPI0028DFB96C|nr:anhydro-N-acetylmuramic acid kinase [Curvibacter sp. APW13]MDT8992978.1 anhydro-N-acetylmuramic acid kinase [Curvibacter sp. APW13]
MRTIGLMSGTSLDGVDGVLAEFGTAGQLQVLAFASLDMPQPLRAELLALNTPGDDELHRSALAAIALVDLYAKVVDRLLQSSGVAANAIAAIGAHGQTVRHRPGEFDGCGYTLQLNNPALLAERTGIAVAADFRSRDVAAGGQGAPLVPAFHSRFLNAANECMAILNIGGISNITLLNPGGFTPVRGFDCGPGNALMDLWCQRHMGQAYDRDGAWARTGRVLASLLHDLLDEDFFRRPPPKSTGRDLFHATWLDAKLRRHPDVATADVQATLCALTAQSCAEALRAHHPQCQRLLVCGGGAFNASLMEALQQALPQVRVESTSVAGLPPQQVEACAFAWLAAQCVKGSPGNLPEVTGARGLRVLGALYPA